MTTSHLLSSLQHFLGEQVAVLFNTALAVEPPGELSSSWNKLLQNYQVTPLSVEKRFAEIQQEKQTKGAPFSEVRSCLQALLSQVRSQLQNSQEQNEDYQQMEQGISHIIEQGMEYYKNLACQKPKGMFGHALATAHKHQYSHLKPGAYVLLCPICGGPRLNKELLRCEYCGGNFTNQEVAA